jgi:hypothetical protein
VFAREVQAALGQGAWRTWLAGGEVAATSALHRQYVSERTGTMVFADLFLQLLFALLQAIFLGGIGY